MLIHSVSDSSKAKASCPLSSGSGICSICKSCVVSTSSSTCTTDSCSSGRQTVPACTETYSMYNSHDEVMFLISCTLKELSIFNFVSGIGCFLILI
jgi:hypothetical protein